MLASPEVDALSRFVFPDKLWARNAPNFHTVIIDITRRFFFVHEFPHVLLMDSMHYSTVIIANVNSKSLRKPVKNGVDFDEKHCTITEQTVCFAVANHYHI